MDPEKLTMEDAAALKRVFSGLMIAPDTQAHLTKLGLIDQLSGGNGLTKVGLRAMGMLR